MSTYTKEKNLIIITLDNANGSYRLDINTGTFYGIKGSPVKTCPRRKEIYSLFPYYRCDGGNNLECVIHEMIANHSNTSAYARYAAVMQSADKIDALGFPLLALQERDGKNRYGLCEREAAPAGGPPAGHHPPAGADGGAALRHSGCELLLQNLQKASGEDAQGVSE